MSGSCMLRALSNQSTGYQRKVCIACKKYDIHRLPMIPHRRYHVLLPKHIFPTAHHVTTNHNPRYESYDRITTNHNPRYDQQFHSSIYKSKYLIRTTDGIHPHDSPQVILTNYNNPFLHRNNVKFTLGTINALNRRYISTQSRCLKHDTKIEQTIKAIKEQTEEKKKEEEKGEEKLRNGFESETTKTDDKTLTAESKTTEVKEVKPVKASLWRRFVNELKHYYHGGRLFCIDIKIASRIMLRVLRGKTLTRRERRQLVRTTADIFRIVPLLVFVIVPFMEFLLPFALKLFPSMLPSTFESENRKQEKLKKSLKVKLEMAKFLQDTIEESSLQRKGGAKDAQLFTDFSEFLNKIRTSGDLASIEDIKKYSKLFEDEITLDNLSRAQLRALCRVLELPTIGPDYLLRFQLRLQVRRLLADDKMILKEGVESMTTWELQSACKQRGMRALGQSEDRLRSQLQQWVDLHLNHHIPTSLLLLSRAMYITETIPATEQIVATMSALPEATATEAKLKAAELSGDKVDNLAKLQRIREEEQAIKKESEEILVELEQAEEMERKMVELETEPMVRAEELKDTALDVDAKEKAREESEKITQKELEAIETAIETLAEEKKMSIDMEELSDLKEDYSDYQEDVAELKEVIVASGGQEQDLRESKAVKRLNKKMSRLIGEMDGFIEQLHVEKRSLQEEIEVKEVRIKHADEQTKRDRMIGEVDLQRTNIVSINDLLLSLKRLQKVPDDARTQTILEVLDEDSDGVIHIDTVLKVIETLGKENVKLNKKQITDVINLIKRESALEDEEKKEKCDKVVDTDKVFEGGKVSDGEEEREKAADKSS